VADGLLGMECDDPGGGFIMLDNPSPVRTSVICRFIRGLYSMLATSV
jgi:hypothetical protein